jgi:hypothetical protein
MSVKTEHRKMKENEKSEKKRNARHEVEKL